MEDLGVLVLFSVFESAVRDHLEGIIRPLTEGLGHPILQHAAIDVLDGIKQGSFANNVLTPLQNQNRITAELSDKVKQVRDYRNWVAHGNANHALRILSIYPQKMRLAALRNSLTLLVLLSRQNWMALNESGVNRKP